LSILHARYDKFANASLTRPALGVGGVPIGGNIAFAGNASGNESVRSPDWTLVITARYFKKTAVGDFDLSATAYHSDEFFFEPGSRVRQPSYQTYSVRLAWIPAGSRFDLEFWGKNLSSSTVIESAFISTLGDGVAYVAPRTVGVTVGYTFE
jgi:iron complex outermembrane receptor protein